MPPLHQIREVRKFLKRLAESRPSLIRATDLSRLASEMFGDQHQNQWIQFVHQILETWRSESDDAEVPGPQALEFLYEACAESRRDFSYGEGVVLSTVHSAKGAEYDHVLLIGPWPLKPDRAQQEEERRAFYVGMTRARKTLTVFDRLDFRPSLPESLAGPAVLSREFTGTTAVSEASGVDYAVLGLDDIHLGYPGQFKEGHPIHTALATLRLGDRLDIRQQDDRAPGLFDQNGTCVARLAQKAAALWAARREAIREVRVLALVHRSPDQDTDQTRRESYRASAWEVPVVEVVLEERDESLVH